MADTLEDINLIVTDMHRRVTGVGSTIRTLVPHIQATEPLAMVSSRPLPGVRSLSLWQTLKTCLKTPQQRPFRIWHARRNKEMLLGLILKHVFRSRLKLVMTSCALRRHSWFPRQLLSAMDAIIATSEEAAGYVDNVVATIPHGVDCTRFQPAADRTAAFRALGVPGDFGVSLVGRIRPEKGTDLFVEAMLRVLPEFPSFTACIAGKVAPEHRRFHENLKAKIEKAGLTRQFVWFGEVGYDQMPAFHTAMSLCVAPARYEGFGLVPLEAMACAVAVVASQTGCYRDVIRPGVTGELVPCGDVDALAASLKKLMESPETLEQMGRTGRDVICDSWSAKLEAERIVDVYRRMWSRAA
ncbi:MAG: glycosyltransferase family 4 protein [Planctomycetaceae bacterium]